MSLSSFPLIRHESNEICLTIFLQANSESFVVRTLDRKTLWEMQTPQVTIAKDNNIYISFMFEKHSQLLECLSIFTGYQARVAKERL